MSKKGRSRKDRLVTVCKLCPYSIYNFQEKEWLCDNLVGWVHTTCYSKRDILLAERELLRK